jgi:hypothetical protein
VDSVWHIVDLTYDVKPILYISKEVGKGIPEHFP